MHGMLSRKERQIEKMELIASKGLTSVTLRLFSNEARRWEKKGLKISSKPDTNYGVYTLSFEHPNLLSIAECNKFVVGKSEAPKELLYGEYLYLLSMAAIFKQSFID